MTDNEIIKALECCLKGCNAEGCEDCPLYEKVEDCEIEIPIIALDLIIRQKTEIENLREEKEIYRRVNFLIAGQRDERDKEIVSLESELKTAKSEAIREFAERMKRCARFGRSAGDTELCYSVSCIEQMLAYVEKKMTKSEGNNER